MSPETRGIKVWSLVWDCGEVLGTSKLTAWKEWPGCSLEGNSGAWSLPVSVMPWPWGELSCLRCSPAPFWDRGQPMTDGRLWNHEPKWPSALHKLIVSRVYLGTESSQMNAAISVMEPQAPSLAHLWSLMLQYSTLKSSLLGISTLLSLHFPGFAP